MPLQAPEFFAELRLPFHDHAVVGNTYLAAPTAGTHLRLRIDFTRTIYADTYGGLRLAVVPPERGAIDAVTLSFLDHDTFHRRDVTSNRALNDSMHGTFNKYHRPGQPPWEGAEFTGLRDAIEQYTTVWFPGAWAASAPDRAPTAARTRRPPRRPRAAAPALAEPRPFPSSPPFLRRSPARAHPPP